MGVWQRISGELATATSRDFERRALPLLRVLWPDITYPPELGAWDKQGSDLVVWSDNGPLPCVVQCKGFKDAHLGRRQVLQVAESAASFLKSHYRCDTYILLHNRTGEDRPFYVEAQNALQVLIAASKAHSVHLWDRQLFLKTVKARLLEMLRTRLVEQSKTYLEQQQHVFRFGNAYIPNVPAAEKRLVVRRGSLATVEEIAPAASINVSDLVLSPTNVRWTLLTGHFGSGKTTTGLMAASRTTGTVIFVRCEAMRTYQGAGTNELLRSTIAPLGLFDDYSDDDRNVLEPLTAPLLTGLLRDRKTAGMTTLILDGLDENRMFSTVQGMQRLSDCLAELVCPIILTTRTEHFSSTFGNFEIVLDNISRKGGGERAARIFELAVWSDPEVSALVRAALEAATPPETPRVQTVLDAIRTGQLWEYFGELPRHPLFLQMVLDVAAASGLRKEGRAALMGDWVAVKIKRDLQKPRATPIRDITDANAFVDQVMHLMESVASTMVVTSGSESVLRETVDSDTVLHEARTAFGEQSINEVGIALNSVLVPAEFRHKKNFHFKFVFRVLQEYFLARYLRQRGLSVASYPRGVKDLHDDLEHS